MNFELKVFLLGIFLTPTTFGAGAIDMSHLENCEHHDFIKGEWFASDTYGPHNIERSTTFKMNSHTWSKSTTYTTTNGDDCTFHESGIIESCRKNDEEYYDENSGLGAIAQIMTLKVRTTRRSFPVSECKGYFYGESGHVALPPYSYLEAFSLNPARGMTVLSVGDQDLKAVAVIEE